MDEVARFPYPSLEPITLPALGEWVLDSAAKQDSWPREAHEEFLQNVSTEVSEVIGLQLQLSLSSDYPDEPEPFFSPDAKIPCASEAEPFEHATDVDSGDPNVTLDPNLLARGKKLCSLCPVKVSCLAYGVQSLELKDGLYGGQTKQQRQAAWQQHSDERAMQRRQAYGPAIQALVNGILATDLDKRAQVRSSLIRLAQPLLEESRPDVPHLDADIRELLAHSVVTERADVLLPSTARRIMRYWVRACQQNLDPFGYERGEYPNVNNYRRTEELVAGTLRQLAAGDFNYRRWYNFEGKNIHNPISFLVRIGIEVPDGDLETLKQIARQKLNLLPEGFPSGSRKIPEIKTLLTEYYGLEDNNPVKAETLSNRYDISYTRLSQVIGGSIKRLRIQCGNLQESEDEDG